jgi:hypothetical protein
MKDNDSKLLEEAYGEIKETISQGDAILKGILGKNKKRYIELEDESRKYNTSIESNDDDTLTIKFGNAFTLSHIPASKAHALHIILHDFTRFI